MTAVNTLLCWTLSSIINIWLVNTPSFTGDAKAFSIEHWKDRGFLDDPRNASNWARWVDAHWGSLLHPAGFVFGESANLFSIAANNARNGHISLNEAKTLSDSKTTNGEIWRVMSGWYVSANQAIASWVGSDTCGPAPPTPEPEPEPTPGPKGYVYYEVSKNPTAQETEIQFGYYIDPTEHLPGKLSAGGKLSVSTTSNGILSVQAINAGQSGTHITGKLTEEDGSISVDLIGIFPTGISLSFNLSLDKGGYLTYDSPTGYTFRETASLAAYISSGSIFNADFGLGSGFDSIIFKIESAPAKTDAIQIVGLGELTNKGHGGWEATATKGSFEYTFQIKANTDNAERPIPWGNDTEAWASVDASANRINYIYGNTPDTLENGQGSNADGDWLSWTIGEADPNTYADIDYRIETWEAGERKKTLATGRLRSPVSSGGLFRSISITYTAKDEKDTITMTPAGALIWEYVLQYYPSVVPNNVYLDFSSNFDTKLSLTAPQQWVYLAKGTGFDDTSKITAAGLAGTQTPMFASIRADDGTYWKEENGKLEWTIASAASLTQGQMMHKTTAFSQAPHRNFWKATDEADGGAVSFELDKQGPNPLAAPTRAAVFLAVASALAGSPVSPDQTMMAVLSKQDTSTAIETKTRDQTISVKTINAGSRVIVGGCSIEIDESMSLKSVAPLGVSWSDIDGHNQPGFIIRYESTGYDATAAARTTPQGYTQTTVLPVYSEIDFSKEQSEEKVTDRLLITGGEAASRGFNISKDNSNTCEVRLDSYNKNTGDLLADVFGFAEGQCWEASCAATGNPGQDTTLYYLGTFKATIPENYFSYTPQKGDKIGTVSTWEGKRILEEMAAVIDADSYEEKTCAR